MNKRGISPVVATVLLISLVVVLAAIIFIWARSAMPEVLIKGGSRIEDSCAQLVFSTDYSPGTLVISNQGNIPIYGFVVSKKAGFGSVESIGNFDDGLYLAEIGETAEIPMPVESAPESDDEIIITPVLLGESDGAERKTFQCSDNAQSLIVS